MSTNPEALIRTYSREFTLIILLGLTLGILAFFINRKLFRRKSLAPWRVRQAVRDNAFSCYFQPIVDIESSRMTGCEVLVRLTDRFGALNPEIFLQEIKRQKLTWIFTRQLINKTFSLLENMHSLPDGFRVSLNIFPQNLNSGEAMELLEMPAAMDTRFRVCLEIIEDELLDHDRSHENMRSLADAGFDIAIDDFGAGYSNLKIIEQIHCTYLKIDRSFIMGVDPDSLNASLIPHIVNIAAELGVKLIAEGIETREQWDYLQRLGVEYGQGYYFSKPLGITTFTQLIEDTGLLLCASNKKDMDNYSLPVNREDKKNQTVINFPAPGVLWNNYHALQGF